MGQSAANEASAKPKTTKTATSLISRVSISVLASAQPSAAAKTDGEKKYTAAKLTPVSSSTTAYLGEIAALQYLHLPQRKT
jgi:hypothetical protein